MLGYFSSYSATKRYIDATGPTPLPRTHPRSRRRGAIPNRPATLRWPMFVHARTQVED